MILYKANDLKNANTRKTKEISFKIEEYPNRPIMKYNSPKEKVKTIKSIESIIRSSKEYKEYIKLLKDKLDLNRCSVFLNIKNRNGKRYRIEIHHEPFTLFDIVQTVINKALAEEGTINAYKIADEVMYLHYSGYVGLIPLAITAHELVHSGRIFIPLQKVYNKFDKFFEEYEDYIDDGVKDKIEAKATLSMKTNDFISDALDVEFTVLNIEGFNFPEIPDEWKNVMNYQNEK